jgi:S1-C subfamily serine protease
MHEDDSAYARPRLRRARGLLIYSVVIVFAAAAGVGATLAARHFTTGPGGPTTASLPVTMNDAAVYSKVEPGVVDVSADLQYLDETAEGTGFVIDAADGLILTNNHVIDGATSVTVTPVLSGKSYPATVVGYDLPDDVAVLQVSGVPGLKAVSIGDSAALAVGSQVLALGNEAGQGGPPTVAPGVISSLGRSIVASDQSSGLTETLHGMLQTNADIRPGDSGGPLANAAGEVIGIDTAAGSGGPGMAFAGYAIPIDTALSIARQIAAGHDGADIQLGLPAFLGVLLPDSSTTSPRQEAQQQEAAGQQERTENGAENQGSGTACLTEDTGSSTPVPGAIAPAQTGALVDGVMCGTAAAAVGIAAGDVITGFGGHSISSASSLSAILNRDRPGARGTLTWVSIGGGSHTALVTLGVGPAG